MEPLQVGSVMASPVETNITQPDAVVPRFGLFSVVFPIAARRSHCWFPIPSFAFSFCLSIVFRAARTKRLPSAALAPEEERAL